MTERQARHMRQAYAVAILFSAVLLFMTAIVASTPGLLPFERHWHLGWENNIAAWWSGALLAASALLVSDGYCRLRDRNINGARAWLVLAAIILFLSADEIGSLHERLGMLGENSGIGPWALVLPLGAFLGLCFSYSAIHLWIAGGEERRRLLWVILAFTLLASVAVQEYFEHQLSWEGTSARVLRLIVEEGTELTGMLILLRVGIGAVMTRNEPPFAFLAERIQGILVLSAISLPLLTWATVGLNDHRGRPADWLSAALFLSAAALAVRHFMSAQQSQGRLLIALFYIAASAIAVAIEPLGATDLYSYSFEKRAILFALLFGGIATLVSVYKGHSKLLAMAFVGIALTFLISPPNEHLSYFLTGLLAIAACLGESVRNPAGRGRGQKDVPTISIVQQRFPYRKRPSL